MPIFYRGSGIGTYWHQNDARVNGFLPRSPGIRHSESRIIEHVGNGTTTTPYVSLTCSYEIAYDYARHAGHDFPSASEPAYVYEIEIPEPLPSEYTLLDPVKLILEACTPPPATPYQHDGGPSFILGVMSPGRLGHLLTKPAVFPPPGGRTPRPPRLSKELEAVARALRDSELLFLGAIPSAWIQKRWKVY